MNRPCSWPHQERKHWMSVEGGLRESFRNIQAAWGHHQALGKQACVCVCTCVHEQTLRRPREPSSLRRVCNSGRVRVGGPRGCTMVGAWGFSFRQRTPQCALSPCSSALFFLLSPPHGGLRTRSASVLLRQFFWGFSVKPKGTQFAAPCGHDWVCGRVAAGPCHPLSHPVWCQVLKTGLAPTWWSCIRLTEEVCVYICPMYNTLTHTHPYVLNFLVTRNSPLRTPFLLLYALSHAR